MKMFLFDHNQKVRQWLIDRDFIEAKMTEQINTADQLTFSVPLNKRLPSSYAYAAIPQPRGSGYLLFKIITEKVSSDQVEYTAVESAYDELKSYHYIKDIRPENRRAGELLQIALDGTRWQVGQTYDSGTFSTNFYYISTLEAIQKIIVLCDLEVTFEIVLNPKTHQIEHRIVNLYAQQGQRTGKRFEYGSNLLTVEREGSAENLITALIGRGKGEAVYHDDSEAEEAPDGYGRRISFADVVWSKANGNPADKPAGQEYVEDVGATAEYGFDDGKPRIGIEIFEDITDPAELLQATWDALQTLKRPQASFRASVMDVGDLGLGDTVAIVRHDIKIEYFTRVYKVTHNLLDEQQNEIELGDDLSQNSITSTFNSLSESVNTIKHVANYAAISADGKNTNYYGQAQPNNPLEGDLWYKDLGNGDVEMYQYHAGNWILITSTVSADQITSGTLNAGKVNVINLNANNITSGTIKGTNLGINLNSGEVNFQHGRIHNYDNTVDIDLDNAYISTANKDTRVILKNGEMQLVRPDFYDLSNDPYLRIFNGGTFASSNFSQAAILGREGVTIAVSGYTGNVVNGAYGSFGDQSFLGLFIGKNADGTPAPVGLSGASSYVNINGGEGYGDIVKTKPSINIGIDISYAKNTGPDMIMYGKTISIAGDNVRIPSAYTKTVSASPNVFVAADGTLYQTTSAARYKAEIERSYSADYGEKLLDIPIATWYDKAEMKRYASGESDIVPIRYFGMIAEDLNNAGLDMLVRKSPDGELSGINYDRIAPALIPVIKNLKKRIEALENGQHERGTADTKTAESSSNT